MNRPAIIPNAQPPVDRVDRVVRTTIQTALATFLLAAGNALVQGFSKTTPLTVSAWEGLGITALMAGASALVSWFVNTYKPPIIPPAAQMEGPHPAPVEPDLGGT